MALRIPEQGLMMKTNNTVSKKYQYLFWLNLGIFSTFFAEVFSGSDMFPFFSVWGLLVVVPLYGLHIIILAHLVYRAEKPRFSSLVFAGMIFGLYEAYLTKVLWAPPWGDSLIIAGIAPIETLVLVFWWHAWFSFIVPLLVAEKLFTGSHSLGQALPGKLGVILNSWGGLAAVMVFGGIFQSINSPSPAASLLSGVTTTAVLAGVTILWKRATRNRTCSMRELLPDQKQFKLLLIPAGLMYLAMGVLIRPDSYPDLIGHLMIWLLYGIAILLLFRSLRSPSPEMAGPDINRWPQSRWLILAGIFPVAAVAGEILLQGLIEPLALLLWFGGILFGLIYFFKALQLTFFKNKEIQNV
jgi:hypothetical protein